MNFVCIAFELGDKMLVLSSMENLIVPSNHNVYHAYFFSRMTVCYYMHLVCPFMCRG